MLIRDLVHGDIDLNYIETTVLDCPEVQRLRAIKQLGTASLIFPGCTHSRFEHSLGTLFVAKRILSILERSGIIVTEQDKLLTSLGALLHDVTHIPFGHTFEDERKIFPRHDKGNRLEYFLLGDGALAQMLRKLGLAQALFDLLSGKINDWRSQIVSSALDADLLDYLRRDAYMAGLSQSYDDRIFQHFMVVNHQLVLRMVKHNMQRPDVRSEIIHLLRMRYYLTERLYYHHAKVISGAMVSKAVELALSNSLTEGDLLHLGDYTLFARLKEIGLKTNPAINSLIRGVEARRLLKRAYVLSPKSISTETRTRLIADYHYRQDTRHQLEQQIAEQAGLEEWQVIVYCLNDQSFKEAAIPVLTPTGLVKLNHPQPPQEIQYLEQQYQQLWRLYVFAPEADVKRVNQICSSLFSTPSEYSLNPLV